MVFDSKNIQTRSFDLRTFCILHLNCNYMCACVHFLFLHLYIISGFCGSDIRGCAGIGFSVKKKRIYQLSFTIRNSQIPGL